jgi:hypothetical protein
MMNDPFSSLLRDALSYAKSQPPQASFFVSPEELTLFASLKEEKRPSAPIVLQPTAKATFHFPLPQQRKPKPTAEVKLESEPVPVKTAAPSPQKPSEEMVKILKKIAPSLALSDQIPDDNKAKQISSAWKEKLHGVDAILIVLSDQPENIELMKNLAKAIHQDLGQVKLISGERFEREKRWELFFQTNSFRLAIVSPGIQQYPELLKLYRALPAQQTAFLAQTPLIVLEPGSTYKDSSEKKTALWKTLCQILKK